MGYYTEFRLEILNKNMDNIYDIEDKNLPAIKVAFNQIFNESLTDDYDAFSKIFSKNPQWKWKWYYHEDDMKSLAHQFPDYYFTLCGEGENREDVWIEQYHGDEFYRDMAEIIEPKRKW